MQSFCENAVYFHQLIEIHFLFGLVLSDVHLTPNITCQRLNHQLRTRLPNRLNSPLNQKHNVALHHDTNHSIY